MAASSLAVLRSGPSSRRPLLVGARRRPVDEPDDLADRSEVLRRRVAVADTDRAEDRPTLLAGGTEGEPAAALDLRAGHGDACLGAAPGAAGAPELATAQPP